MTLSNNNQPILSVSDLSVTYTDEKGSLQALQQINFAVDPEQFICIVGPSGSGKSTLLKILAGLLIPTQGQGSLMESGCRARGKEWGLSFKKRT